VSRKELARALLQARRPVEARQELERALATGADSECYWLLSRAYLQEDETAEALGVRAKAGPLRNEHPLLPEPVPYVGSWRSAECHASIYDAQQNSRHGRTFRSVADLRDLKLFPVPRCALLI
jgi:hypothetical protein